MRRSNRQHLPGRFSIYIGIILLGNVANPTWAGGKIYQYVDAQGHTHYGDAPPPQTTQRQAVAVKAPIVTHAASTTPPPVDISDSAKTTSREKKSDLSFDTLIRERRQADECRWLGQEASLARLRDAGCPLPATGGCRALQEYSQETEAAIAEHAGESQPPEIKGLDSGLDSRFRESIREEKRKRGC